MPEGRLARTRANYPPQFWKTRSDDGACYRIGETLYVRAPDRYGPIVFKPSWQGRARTVAEELAECDERGWKSTFGHYVSPPCPCKSLDSDLGCMHTERQPMK